MANVIAADSPDAVAADFPNAVAAVGGGGGGAAAAAAVDVDAADTAGAVGSCHTHLDCCATAG